MPIDTPKTLTLINGAEIEFSDKGQGTPVLFLHGYSDSWFSFDCVVSQLPNDIRAISPTHRGHGGSSKPATGYSIEQMAADTIALLDCLQVDKVCACGHSMGTFIAQELAISYPERISALSLVGGALSASNEVLCGFSEELNDFEEPVSKEFVTEFQTSTVANPVDTEMMNTIINESLKMPARLWKPILDCLIAYKPSKPFANIDVPVMVHWGTEDEIFPLADQHLLREQLPQIVFHEYQNVGHGLHWEKPGEFAKDLLNFIKDNNL